MVQGAPQVAGRFPEELRMYKAPPPEISSEQFYETDPARGFARGFSIQTVGPLPIGWAEHVLADGHWGQALREYMRDYNHWCDARRPLRAAAAGRRTASPSPTRPTATACRSRASTTRQCDNDRANIAYAKQKLQRDLRGRRRAGHPRRSTATPTSSAAARMGSSPEHSVIDSDHRAWGVPNLFVCDGSVMPTQGSANPALTIMALASRLAERLDAKRVGGAHPARGGAGRRGCPGERGALVCG